MWSLELPAEFEFSIDNNVAVHLRLRSLGLNLYNEQQFKFLLLRLSR
jgi:hypothetical protein